MNVAARLTELAKREYDGVLVSEETVVAAGESGADRHIPKGWKEAGTVVVRGRTQPTRMFQPEC